MRILHVITSLRTGGAEKLMVDLLPRMKAGGDVVELCVFDGVKTPFYDELERKGIVIHALGKSVYSLLNILKLISLIRNYDIVHTHNTACQYYVMIASYFVPSRLFTTEHNTDNRRRRNLFWKILDKWMYGRYETVICISEETKENLLRHLYGDKHIQAKKYKLIYNGINVANYIPKKQNVSAEAGKPSYIILMVSAFRWQKDQKTVVRALSLLNDDYKVWFVGDGDSQLKDECQLLAKSLSLDEKIEFWGLRDDIPDLMHKADVVVQSSFVDGFCLAAVEGMASGTPVIVSDIPGVGDIVRGYGILFPHEDAKALSEAIQKVCEDKDYREEVVKKCQERARMFDISVMAKKYMEVYKYGHVIEDVDLNVSPYSIAVRTLGLAGDKFRKELESLSRLTVKPQKVVVYISDDNHDVWQNGSYCGEEYISVEKGMVAQRALPYHELKTEYVLLLDDDVELAPDSVAKMMKVMVGTGADCVGADTYQIQEMSLWQKIYAMVTNLVFPHRDKNWAFKIHPNGSFSYFGKGLTDGVEALPTQYVAGPCALWKKEAIQRLHWEDEKWMDEMEFSYMDDTVESYKLHVNGGKMYLLYDSGVKNLNAKTASGNYRSKATMFYTRARSTFCVWWRTIYEVDKQRGGKNQASIMVGFIVKALWLMIVNLFAGLVYLNLKIPYYYVKGLADGWRFVHSEDYRMIPPYRLV